MYSNFEDKVDFKLGGEEKNFLVHLTELNEKFLKTNLNFCSTE